MCNKLRSNHYCSNGIETGEDTGITILPFLMCVQFMRDVWTKNTTITATMFVQIIVNANAMMPTRPTNQSHNLNSNQVCRCGATIMLLMTLAKLIERTMHQLDAAAFVG